MVSVNAIIPILINITFSKQQQNMDKTISQADNSTIGGYTRSMAVSSRQKFQNVEKLGSIVREAESSSRSAQPEQILNMIKNKIKNNYNTLYDNYDANKNVIKKTIQQTENNDAGENAIKAKFQNVIKDKNIYDRLKAEVQEKQRKLKKLIDIKNQVKVSVTGNDQLRQTLSDRMVIIKYLEEHKEILEYQTAILKNMSKDRTQVKLNLKERHQIMLNQQAIKKQRISKIQDAAHTKKILLQRIEQKIAKEEQCEIPLSLAEQLEKKLQQYEGMHAQENIIAHETKISEQKAQEERQLLAREQQLIAKINEAKQNEDKKQFQIAYNFLLLRQAEQEKIKKLCGVQSLRQIANDTLLEEREKLERIQQSIEKQISQTKKQNQQIRKDIETIMTTMENNQGTNLLLKVQKQLQNEETQVRRLKIHNEKKNINMNQWQAIMHLLTEGNCDKGNMGQKLRQLTNKYEDLSMKDRLENDMEGKRSVGKIKSAKKKSMKINIQNQSKAESQGEQLND